MSSGYGKILYATDNRESALSDKSLRKLKPFFQPGADCLISIQPDEKDESLRRLEKYGLSYVMIPCKRPSAGTIIPAAEGEKIIVTALDIRNYGRFSLSRLISKLMHKVNAPILLMNNRQDIRDDKDMFDAVILAMDFKKAPEYKFQFISAWKNAIKTLEIVNVINEKLTVGDMRALNRKIIETRESFRSLGFDAESHIYAGKTHSEILKAAEDYKATLIIMGSGLCRSKLSKIFNKGPAIKTAVRSKTAVLIIP